MIELPNAVMVIVGDGADRNKLQETVESNDMSSKVLFVGRQDAVERYYYSAHFLWQLSESEAMPMVVLEAMAAGVPVIGFDVRGTRDAVANAKTGRLVSYGDTDGIAMETIRIFRSQKEYKVLSRNARARVEKHFSLDVMIDSHEQILSVTAGQ